MSPWTNYTFRVIARNKVGDSLPSGHSKVCLTPEDVPYKNPDNVMGRGHAPNNLVISWTVSQTSLFSVAKATLELALSVDQSWMLVLIHHQVSSSTIKWFTHELFNDFQGSFKHFQDLFCHFATSKLKGLFYLMIQKVWGLLWNAMSMSNVFSLP